MGRAIEVRQILLATGAIVGDAWIHLDDAHPIPHRGDITVSLERLEANLQEFAARRDLVGVRVEGHAEPSRVAKVLDHVALVVVHVVKFTDGRHFSLARLLRERHGWRFGLRAVGDVLPDQVLNMRRCGYDAFELRPDTRAETARHCLKAFSVAYQGDAIDARPLYRRRLAETSSAA